MPKKQLINYEDIEIWQPGPVMGTGSGVQHPPGRGGCRSSVLHRIHTRIFHQKSRCRMDARRGQARSTSRLGTATAMDGRELASLQQRRQKCQPQITRDGRLLHAVCVRDGTMSMA